MGKNRDFNEKVFQELFESEREGFWDGTKIVTIRGRVEAIEKYLGIKVRASSSEPKAVPIKRTPAKRKGSDNG